MKCIRHTDRDAVAQCENCGAGVCYECAQKTLPARESQGTLCIECYTQGVHAITENIRKDIKKTRSRVIWSIILYVFGLLVIIANLIDGIEPLMLVVGFIFCGIYTGLTWHKAAKQAHDDYEREHGASYTITDTGVYKDDGFWMKLLFFFIGAFLGIIVTPIRVIIDIKSLKTKKQDVEDFTEVIAELNEF